MSVVGAHLCYTAPSAKIFVSKLFSGSPLQVCRRQVYENLDQAMSSLHHPTGSSPEIIISVWKRHWGGTVAVRCMEQDLLQLRTVLEQNE